MYIYIYVYIYIWKLIAGKINANYCRGSLQQANVMAPEGNSVIAILLMDRNTPEITIRIYTQ